MNTEYSFVILVFSYIWKNLGYDIILWLAALATIAPESYEAAKTDGAGGEGMLLLYYDPESLVFTFSYYYIITYQWL